MQARANLVRFGMMARYAQVVGVALSGESRFAGKMKHRPGGVEPRSCARAPNCDIPIATNFKVPNSRNTFESGDHVCQGFNYT
jgi:hypothetical protein